MASDKRVALVTGGRRGIGLGVARCLAAEGYDLAICGTAAEADEAVGQLQQHGGQVLYVQADVSQPADRQKLLEQLLQRFGHLDVLVNNAGVAPQVRADILQATEESFQRLIQINLQGPFFLTQLVARQMIEQKKTHPASHLCIVNVSSISATVVSVNRADYCISKAGVAMATQLWAARLGEFGIPVYEIRPGIIATDMTAGVKDKYDRLIAQGLLVQGRWGQSEDVGRAVAMLARGDLAYSTGQVLNVDGGLCIQRL